MNRVVVVLALSMCACIESPAQPEVGQSTQPIVGGEPTTEFPAVGLIEVGAARCTATLIADTVMVTAAHCIYDSWDGGTRSGKAFFGPTRADAVSVDIDNVIPSRFYRPEDIRVGDIAVVRLAQAPEGITPLPWNREPLPASTLGQTSTVVGFGVTDGEAQTGAGTKRVISLVVDEVTDTLLGFGDDDENICQGDSGGPTFLDIDGVPTVVAVSSFGSNFCRNRSFVTRTDAYQDFVQEVLEAWSGPCRTNGQCVTDGCGEYADPDCDICGLEGVCAADCPDRDLDCPLLGLVGDLCDTDPDCEFGMCVAAEDDPRIGVCSEPCALGGDASECSGDLDLCVERDGQGACVYSGPTPSAQGAECVAPSECRSGICDTENEICVELCDGSCPAPYSCEGVGGGVKVCTFAEGGCCTLAPGRSRGVPPAGSLLCGAIVMLFLWRIRRQVR